EGEERDEIEGLLARVVVHGPGDNEEEVLVLLDLGTGIRIQRVLEGEGVEAEQRFERVDLLRLGPLQVDPAHGALLAEGLGTPERLEPLFQGSARPANDADPGAVGGHRHEARRPASRAFPTTARLMRAGSQCRRTARRRSAAVTACTAWR